ncbi:MAG: PAS domain S-box protein [Deltaproteobacteria bacterium]|nr:PAS domain S-box protein [Deltaproteobacteria bacterium]
MQKGKNLNRPARGSTIKVEPIRRAGDIEAIERLLVDNPRNLALFTMGINTNLRVGELLKIKIHQVQGLELTDETTLRVKNGKSLRKITLNKACVEAIQSLIHNKLRNRKKNGQHPPDFLFSGPSGAALTVPTVNNLVKKWCAAVNLAGNYGGHTLRKTFGYQQVVRFRASLPEIMVLFNHSKPLQTLDYLCIQPEEFQHVGRTGTSKTPKPGYEELMQRIEELQKTVSRLRESEEKFRTIFENVSDEIIYLDNNGTVLEINDRCEDLFGLKREEVIGKKFFDFGYMEPEDMQKLADQYIDVLDQTTSRMDEFEIVRTDGAKVFIETNASFVESEG